MPWSGGTFTRQYGAGGWTNDKNSGTKILSSRHDTNDQDLADGVNACLTKDNTSKPTATFLPGTDASYALGSTTYRWTSAYVSSSVVWRGGTYNATLNYGTPTANRTLSLPDETGTLATQAYSAGLQSRVLLSTQTAAAAATVDFTNLLTSTYDHFELWFWRLYPATNGSDIWLRGGAAVPGWVTGASYNWALNATIAAGTNSPTGGAADTKIALAVSASSTAANGAFGRILLSNDSTTSGFSARYELTYSSSAGNFASVRGGGNNGNSCPSARIQASAGNINGTFALYGVLKT